MNQTELKNTFEQFVSENFENMPTHKVANVFLMLLGRMIVRFDTKGKTELSKEEFVKMIEELVEIENDPKTTVERLLKRSEKRKKINKIIPL